MPTDVLIGLAVVAVACVTAWCVGTAAGRRVRCDLVAFRVAAGFAAGATVAVTATLTMGAGGTPPAT